MKKLKILLPVLFLAIVFFFGIIQNSLKNSSDGKKIQQVKIEASEITIPKIIPSNTQAPIPTKAIEEQYNIKKISPYEAKQRLETEKEIIILYIRNLEDYNKKHIPNSISIPVIFFEDIFSNKLPNKNSTIFLYSSYSAQNYKFINILNKNGYNNVFDLGDISEWPYKTESIDNILPTATPKVTATTGNLQYKNITPEEAKIRLDKEQGIILLDVRSASEYAVKHIAKSVLIPVDVLNKEAENKLKDKNAMIFVYCASGGRSRSAVGTLAQKGYKNVYNLGGISSWPYETGEITKPS